MRNKSPRKIGGATEKVGKSKEFDYCWKILSFNLSEMENVAHKEKLDGSASTSAYHFWRGQEPPLYIFLFGFYGLQALVNNDAAAHINRTQHNAMIVGIVCTLALRWVIRRLMGKPAIPGSSWKFTPGLLIRFVTCVFLDSLLGNYLSLHYAAELEFQLYGLFWGAIIVSLRWIAFDDGKSAGRTSDPNVA